MGGLCEDHHREDAEKQARRRSAITVLHRGLLDDKILQNEELRAEFERLRRWWHQACDSVNFSRPHAILRDEAEYATDWCIALAQEIIDAERNFRAGKAPESDGLEFTRLWVWERFENLERGLMSNGIERQNV